MRGKVVIFDALTWEEGLPRPQWEFLRLRVEAEGDARSADETHEVWSGLARQWLEALRDELGKGYQLAESDNFLLLLSARVEPEPLLRFAERCRHVLLSAASGVTDFAAPGKQVVLQFREPGTFYSYLAAFSPEGEYGEAAGVQVREGYPHIVLCGADRDELENTLAHEMTHASLQHLTMPVWVEEGLAQMFEHDMTGRQLLELTEERAREHKRHWKRRGLNEFWDGDGFSQAGEPQKLNYELAEVLLRLLWEDHRPRWFGLAKGAQERFFRFLRSARRDDAGAAAARAHLQCGLSDIAAKFLGEGDWDSRW
jgi:hypothetical protein